MSPVHVLGLGLWTPGFDGPARWLSGQADPAILKPGCDLLPPRERRATSLTTRLGVEVIGQALSGAGVDLSAVRLIFGSTYGELQTAIAQMEMMASDDGRLSPARFKNSVHNTPTGLLSIALGNRSFSTALAAGSATFAMGLLEALTLISLEGGSAVVAVVDEWPGEPFGRHPPFQPLGVALCLSAEAPPGSDVVRLSGLRREEWLDPLPELPEALRDNPSAAGLPLVDAVLRRRGGRVPVELGVAAPWSLEVDLAGRI